DMSRPSLIPLILLSSCSVLKNKDLLKTDSLERREAAASEKITGVSSLTQQRVLLLTDSSGTHFLTEIIPDGEFKLAADGTFTGKASLIRMEGSRKTYSALKDSGSVNEHAVLNKETEGNEKTMVQNSSVAKKKEVKKPRSGALLFVLVAPALLAGAWWFFRKRVKESW
ncbi:hypothetical protein, partial [Pararcticibacter amylolyticus]